MIVGVSGYARSGKDTVAKILVQDHGFQQTAFADPLRDCLLALNPLIQYKLDYLRLREGVEWYGWERLKEVSPDVRPLLQRMGTDVGRNILGPDTWIDVTLNKMQQPGRPENRGQSWVISDCRFLNEATAIDNAGGVVIRVHRPGFGPANDHISEVALDDYAFDQHIINNGTEADLRVSVSHFCKKFGRVNA